MIHLKEGRTPLHYAVDKKHLNIVTLLISKGVDANAKTNVSIIIVVIMIIIIIIINLYHRMEILQFK